MTHNPQTATSTSHIQAFLTLVSNLTWNEANLICAWDALTNNPGLDDAINAAEAHLNKDTKDNALCSSGYRLRVESWADLRQRINLPDWPASPATRTPLVAHLTPILEQTLLALHVRAHLTPAQFDALTATWRDILHLPGTRPLDCFLRQTT